MIDLERSLSARNQLINTNCKKYLKWTNEKCVKTIWIRDGHASPMIFGVCSKYFEQYKNLPFNLKQTFVVSCKKNIRRVPGEKGE